MYLKKGAKFYKEIYGLRPWYHDFSSLGVQTNFENSLPLKEKLCNWYLQKVLSKKIKPLNLRGYEYALNQKSKEEFILPYLQEAIARSQRYNNMLSFLEMFCADGYYSFYVKKNSHLKVVGVDIFNSDIKRCFFMNEYLNLADIYFECKDVFEIDEGDQYDIILCAGGLYHISDPVKLLKKCYKITKQFLILQTVITQETNSPDYFVTPAPGWQHGCRFSDSWLKNRLEEIGWITYEHATNELTGNYRACDKGSSYYLLGKKKV